MPLKRALAQDVLEGAKYFPVVAILGPRQSGKTTLAQMTFPKYAYVSLEDLDLQQAAQQDPRTFLSKSGNEYGLIIDEFQNVPDLLSYIQTMVDEQQEPGKFILTGSQNFLINQSITQSLAGRVSLHTLLPLSIADFKLNGIELPDIETMLYQGCYPAIYAKSIPPKRLYPGYIQTYIERDVRQLSNIGDLRTFQKFIVLCAARVGQLLNLSSIGNECGVSDATVKRWLSILEASYIVFLLQPYYKNYNKRVVKSPKLYFYDTGLLCQLLSIEPEALVTHPNKGNFFESFVISELYKQSYTVGKRPSLYFWRDKVGREVDCLIDKGLHATALEIKASRTVQPAFFDHLNYWKQLADQKSDTYLVFGGDSTQATGRDDVISWQTIDQIV